MAAIHRFGVGRGHARGNIHAGPGKFGVDDRLGQDVVKGVHQPTEFGLLALRTAHPCKQGPTNGVIQEMDVGTVLVLNLGRGVAAFAIGDVDHCFLLPEFAKRGYCYLVRRKDAR